MLGFKSSQLPEWSFCLKFGVVDPLIINFGVVDHHIYKIDHPMVG